MPENSLNFVLDELIMELPQIEFISSLGRIGNNKAVEPLIDLLNEDDSNIRKESIIALGKIGDSKAVEPLIDLLNEDDSNIRKESIIALGKIGDSKAIETLIDSIKKQDNHESIASSLISISLKENEKFLTDYIISPIKSLLESDSIDYRIKAVTTLGYICSKINSDEDISLITTLIIKLFHQKDIKVRKACASALGVIGSNLDNSLIQNVIIEELIFAVAGKNLDYFESFREKIDNVFSLKNNLSTYIKSSNAIADADIKARKEMGYFNGIKKGSNQEKLLHGIIRIHKKKDLPRYMYGEVNRHFIGYEANQALIKIGQKAVEPLIQTLEKSKGKISISIIKSLGEIGDPRAVEPLIRKLSDKDKDILKTSIMSLGKIGDSLATEPLLKKLKDDNKAIKIASIQSLGEIGDPRAVEPLIQSFKSEDLETQNKILETLGLIKDPLSAESFIFALNDDNPRIVSIAARSLGELNDKNAIDPLFNALNIADHDLSEIIIEAIDQIGWVPDKSEKTALYWFNKQEWDKCAELSDFGIVLLLESLENEKIYNQIEIVKTLGELNSYNVLDHFINFLNGWTSSKRIEYEKNNNNYFNIEEYNEDSYTNHQIAELRGHIALALGKIGNKKAVDPLIRSLRDFNRREFTRSKEEFEFCRSVIKSLSLLGDQRAISPIITVMEKNITNIGKEATDALDELGWIPSEDKFGAIYWISKRNWNKCVEIGEDAVKPLMSLFDDKKIEEYSWGKTDYEMINGSIYALGNIRNNEAFSLILNSLEPKETRKSASEALEKYGVHSIEPLMSLIENNENKGVKTTAINILNRVGKNINDFSSQNLIINTLKSTVNDENRYVRRVSLIALGEILKSIKVHLELQEFIELFIAAFNDVDIVKKASINALAAIGSETIPILIKNLKQDNDEFNRSIINTIELIGDPEANRYITNYFLERSKDDSPPLIQRSNPKIFRVFVSSTFNDLKNERDALQTYVFPKLSDLCKQLGGHFQAIDLRWGVSEEAGLDQQTMNICLEEIERSQKVSPRPNFIVLLGDRYGWKPLPYEIDAKEFDDLLKHLSDPEKELLLWNDMQPKNKKGLYRLDTNAKDPVYCIQPRTGEYVDYEKWTPIEQRIHSILFNSASKLHLNDNDFLKYYGSATEQEIRKGVLNPPEDVPDVKEHVFCFFRNFDDESLKIVKEACKHPLQKIPKKEFDKLKKEIENDILFKYYQLEDDFYVLAIDKNIDNKEYDKLEYDIINNLKSAARKCSFEDDVIVDDKLKEKYLASDFIDLISLQENEGNILYNLFDENSHIKLNNLKNSLEKLIPKNIFKYEARWNNGLLNDHIGYLPEAKDEFNDYLNNKNIKSLCKNVFLSLSNVIINEMFRIDQQDSLELEVSLHQEFGKDRSRFFTGRKSILSKIENYLNGEGGKPFIVVGDSGLGKSALMAFLVKKFFSDFYESNDIYQGPIVRFIGATPDSSDIRSLMESICYELTKKQDLDNSFIPTDFEELKKEFIHLLENATNNNPIFLIIDALDQLNSSTAQNLIGWIPKDIPKNVYLIISSLKGDENEILLSIEDKWSKESIIYLDEMSLKEGQILLEKWLNSNQRSLNRIQKEDILNKFEEVKSPLFLQLAFQEAIKWKSYDKLPVNSNGKIGIGENINEIIDNLFVKLSDNANHGSVFLKHSLGYLCLSKYGINENELIDLLSADEKVFNNFIIRTFHKPPSDKIPIVLWSRLYHDLKDYLIFKNVMGSSLLTFFHRQLKDYVNNYYILTAEKQYFQEKMAIYYENQDNWFKSGNFKIPNQRKSMEVIYHQLSIEDKLKLNKNLTEFDFITAKCTSGLVNDLVTEYEEYLNLENKNYFEKSDDKILSYAKFIGSHNEIFSKNPELIYQQAAQYLPEFSHESKDYLVNNNITWLYWVNKPFNDKLYQQDPFGKITAISNDNIYAASVFDNLVHLWKLKTREYIRTFKGHNKNIIDVLFSSDNYHILTVSDDSSIKLWNFETGEYLRTFKVNGKISGVLSYDDYIIIANTYNEIKIWNYKGDVLDNYEISDKKVIKSMGWLTKGEEILIELDCSLMDDCSSIRTLKINKAKINRRINGNFDQKIITSQFTSVGNEFFALELDNEMLNIWNMEKREKLKSFPLNDDPKKVYISSDGHFIVKIHKNNKIELININEANQYFYKLGKEIKSILFTYKPGVILIQTNSNVIYLLDIISDSCEKLFNSDENIQSIAISYDHSVLAIADKQNVLTIFNIENKVIDLSFKLRHILGNVFNSICFSFDGNYVISGGEDKFVRIFDLKNCDYKDITGHKGQINFVQIDSNNKYIFSASSDFSVKIWDFKTKECIKTYNHKNEVQSIFISEDDNYVLSLDSKGVVKQWDLSKNAFKDIYSLDTGIILFMGKIDGINSVITLSETGNLRIWNISRGNLIREIKIFNFEIDKFFMSLSGKYAILCDKTQNIQLWDMKKGKFKFNLENIGHQIGNFIFSADDNYILGIIDSLNTLIVWNTNNGTCLWELEDSSKFYNSSKIIEDENKYLAVLGSENGPGEIYSLNNGKELGKLQRQYFHSKNINSLKKFNGKLSNDYPFSKLMISSFDKALSVHNDDKLKIWDMETGELIDALDNDSKITALELTSEGEAIIGAENGNINMTSFNSSFLFKNETESKEPITSLAIQSDGKVSYSNSDRKIIITNDFKNEIYVYEQGFVIFKGEDRIEQNFKQELYLFFRSWPKNISLTSDSHHMIIWAEDYITIWEIATGHRINSFRHPCEIKVLAIAQDNNHFITAGSDHIIRIWNIYSEEPINALTGHNDEITELKVFNEKCLLSSSYDTSIRLWNLKNSSEIANYYCMDSIVSADISKDAKKIAALDTDSNFYLFEINNLEY